MASELPPPSDSALNQLTPAANTTSSGTTHTNDEDDDSDGVKRPLAAPVTTVPASSPNANPTGPHVLILGGCGFIGRHLVQYLTENKLCSHITVADKALAATSHMNAKHRPLYEDKALLTFIHSDLSKDAHIERVFKDKPYEFVFNLCGETRFGLREEEYQLKCVDTASKCSTAASRLLHLKKFVEISTAQVYKPDKTPSTETTPLKPWTRQALKRLEAEKIVQTCTGLPTVTLRPAIVYGTGDLTGLTPRISCACVYKELGEKMRVLWNEELKINVVHVDDLAAAMWIAANEAAPGSVYNLCDSQDLTQGKLNKWLSTLFQIEVSYVGSLMSNLAKMNLSGVAEDANDKHVPVFTQLCQKHNVLNTPISPYIDQELLRDNHLSVDGSKITRETSFKYKRQISYDLLVEQVKSFIEQGVFPPLIAM